MNGHVMYKYLKRDQWYSPQQTNGKDVRDERTDTCEPDLALFI